MALKNLSSVVRSLGVKANPPCVSTPGKFNSCESPSGGSPMKIGQEGGSPPPPCCGLFRPIPSFESVTECRPDVTSAPIPSDGITCSVELTVTPIVEFSDVRLQIGIFINGVYINDLTPGIGYTFTISPGDSFYFGIMASTIPNGIAFSLKNETCDIDYGIIGYLNPLRDPLCSIYPSLDQSSLITPSNTLVSSAYYYGGGSQTISLDFAAGTLIFNSTTDIKIYYGPDPTYSNNPSTFIVSGGNPTGIVAIPLNPSDYFFIEAITGDDFCSDYELQIENQCPLCAQSFLIAEIVTNSLAC